MILENKSEKQSTFNTCPSQTNLEIELERKEVEYKDLSLRFKFSKVTFKRQFAHIYFYRLMKMKEKLTQTCSLKWGQQLPFRKLTDVTDETSGKCIVIGTIYKYQKLKPSILKEFSEENQMLPQQLRSSYVSDSDLLILEDDVERIRLVGSFQVKEFVSGIVVGVLGFENNDGKFEVEDICFAGVQRSLERPMTAPENSFLIMVSGLDVDNAKCALALELLIDSIKGNLGGISDQEMWAKVSRVLIAGNCVTISQKFSYSTDSLGTIETVLESNTVSAIKEADDLLVDLVRSVEVDLMPGEFDPSNHILPQQAIFDCVFPKASKYKSLHCVTNPYECSFGGRRILGSSGQPVNDIRSLSDIEDSLEILEKTLHWGHLAPTAPDTLDCYPYYEDDPFIIFEQPDIYFVGNQPEFKAKLINLNGHQTKLISIPQFCKTQTCVSVNLQTLECTPIVFTT